jgi:hypothetical protein
MILVGGSCRQIQRGQAVTSDQSQCKWAVTHYSQIDRAPILQLIHGGNITVPEKNGLVATGWVCNHSLEQPEPTRLPYYDSIPVPRD